MKEVGVDVKEWLSAALVFVFGAAVSWQSSTMAVGTLTDMGPGFFPLCLGSLSMLIASMMAIRLLSVRMPASVKPSPFNLRGWTFITAGLAAFILLGRYAGFLPATFSIVFLSSLADRKNTVRDAFILSIAMAIVCAVIFWWALKIQLNLWGPN